MTIDEVGLHSPQRAVERVTLNKDLCMAYFDDWFSFPVRVYTGFSLDQSRREEEKKEEPVEADWVMGIARVPKDVLTKREFHIYDGYTKTRELEDVVKEGFDLTIVGTKDYGEFACTWERKRFEREVEKFMEGLGGEYKKCIPS